MAEMNDQSPLSAVGEFRLIEEVVLPLAREYGLDNADGADCAYIDASGVIAVSGDVGPRPLLLTLPGFEKDYEAMGWLAVVATASDIATAGATPLFMGNLVDAPPDLAIGALRNLLRGIFSAASAFGFANGGGDLRQGANLTVRTFGAGRMSGYRRLGRRGARNGDHVVLIGAAGEMMAHWCLARLGNSAVIGSGELSPAASAVLRYPRPQLATMQRLVKAGILTAASDTSDGLLGALDNIARSSNVALSLSLMDEMLSPTVRAAAATGGYDPWNLFCAWGDWAVAATVAHESIEAFDALCRTHTIDHFVLGRVISGPRQLTASLNGGPERPIAIVRNENFIHAGFNAGLEDHLAYMLETPLFKVSRR